MEELILLAICIVAFIVCLSMCKDHSKLEEQLEHEPSTVKLEDYIATGLFAHLGTVASVFGIIAYLYLAITKRV